MRPSMRLEMREDLEIARRARPDVHMAAFAGHRDPAAAGADQPGDAEPGAGAKHDAAGAGFRRAAADLLHVLLAERHHGQRLRLEIVEHDHVGDAGGWRACRAA